MGVFLNFVPAEIDRYKNAPAKLPDAYNIIENI